MPRSINPYTDFGFKRLFGSLANKALLIDFLNCLVLPEHTIADLEFRSTENLPTTALERRAIFDIRCTAQSGQHFIVKMQKAKFHHFKDRALFYATFPIKEQAEVGEWDFRLQPVYFVALLDFLYDEMEEKAKLLREVQLRDQDGEAFSDKLHFRFVQMPAFRKTGSEVKTQFDKWCFFLKNLESFDVLSELLREPVFEQGIETLREAALTKEELPGYEQSLKDYRDLAVYIHERESDARAESMIEMLREAVAEGDLTTQRAQEKLRALLQQGRITEPAVRAGIGLQPDIRKKSCWGALTIGPQIKHHVAGFLTQTHRERPPL